jgi:hypothetical protein
MVGTTMFWDIETDPGSKSRNPSWIGLVPNSGRGPAFAVVFLMCTLQVLAKAIATALLVVTSTSSLACYIVVDHVAHLVYRILRLDLVFYVSLPRTASYIAAPVLRVLMKVVNE